MTIENKVKLYPVRKSTIIRYAKEPISDIFKIPSNSTDKWGIFAPLFISQYFRESQKFKYPIYHRVMPVYTALTFFKSRKELEDWLDSKIGYSYLTKEQSLIVEYSTKGLCKSLCDNNEYLSYKDIISRQMR